MPSDEVILEVKDLVKYFPITQGIVFKKKIGDVRAVDGVNFDLHRARRSGWSASPAAASPRSPSCSWCSSARRPASALYKGEDIYKLSGKKLRRLRRQIQIVLQDPYTSLNPRMTVGDIVGEPFEIHPDVAPEGRPAQAGAGAARGRRPQPRVHQPLPAPVLRRSAPAHRHRPRPRAATRDHHLRRAGVGARRVGAGAGDEPARGPAERVRPVLPLHRARPVGGPAHLRPRRRHVPRQDRGDRHRGRDLRAPDAPVHAGAALGRAGAGPDAARSARPDHPGGRRAEPGEPAVGLPVPHPLLEGAGHLRARRSRRWSCARPAPTTRAPATSPRSATSSTPTGTRRSSRSRAPARRTCTGRRACAPTATPGPRAVVGVGTGARRA